MRMPIVLMLLTVLLLPADLRGLAAQVQSGVESAGTAMTKLLDRDHDVKVAEAQPKPALGGKVTQVQ